MSHRGAGGDRTPSVAPPEGARQLPSIYGTPGAKSSTNSTGKWKFFSTLFWAPAFPLIRATTARLTGWNRAVFLGSAILVANLHGLWLINNPDLSDEALSGTEVTTYSRSGEDDPVRRRM